MPVPPSQRHAVDVAGPDGALWFTESSANKIGRATTAGVFIEYPVLTVASGPWDRRGPDGAPAYGKGHKIGRITTAERHEHPIVGDMSNRARLRPARTGPCGSRRIQEQD